jgi:hypothetical protein
VPMKYFWRLDLFIVDGRLRAGALAETSKLAKTVDEKNGMLLLRWLASFQYPQCSG